MCASSSAIVLASHLNAGKISPDKIDSAWFVNPPKLDYAKYVSKALNEGSIQESFTDLQPNVISMKTVVGKEYDATPMFSDMLEYIVFNPHWTVPYSIASEEMLPKIKADPGYLPRNNYKLLDGWGRNANEVDPYQVNWSNISKDNFSYVIEQQSGSFNALGAVKFMFPNDNSIYMHDTPAEYLFEKDDRDYSHGCIRLENPFELAEYLLRNKSGWDQQKQQEVMSKEEPVNVYLPEPIPVHIVYLTSWVDKYGNLNFRNDIYGHDTAQKRAIEIKEEAL